VDIVVRVTVYADPRALAVEVLLRNASGTDLVVPVAMPVSATIEQGGGCAWPGVTKVLTNGKMYYDPGKVLDFTEGTEASGWWNSCFYAGDHRDALVVGYLGNPTALGQVRAWRPEGVSGRHFSLEAVSSFQKTFVLSPGAETTTDRVILLVAEDPFSALEAYADCLQRVYGVRLNPVVNGWCSWFSYFDSITEDEVLRNAGFAAEHLRDYGLSVIQVDDGYQRCFGEWEGHTQGFPHGMGSLAQRIRDLGLVPGIWVAPYAVASDSRVFGEHPEWMIHHPDGRLQLVHPYLPETADEVQQAERKTYALDPSHPGAAEWFRALFDRVANVWGYDFIKTDFTDWTLLAAEVFHVPSATRAGLYRQGSASMRDAVGPDRHLLDCGPGPVAIGTFDSMRIELDQPPVLWQQYFGTSASSGPAAAKRYCFHGRTWINDPDHLVMMYLTQAQSRAAATLIGLSGGTVMSGDRLYDLDAGQLAILRSILPAYGRNARPVDLFERDIPEVFALPIQTSFADWTVLGVFNADEERESRKTLSLERVGLDPEGTYLAFDFWERRFVGEVRGEFVSQQAPSSVQLLALHRRRGVPQVLSTDRHITQGAIELESTAWDEDAGMLRGVSLGPLGSDHRVYVYTPEPVPWRPEHRFFPRESECFTAKRVEPHIVRVHVRFKHDTRVEWTVSPADH
jgi:hypothetical protein